MRSPGSGVRAVALLAALSGCLSKPDAPTGAPDAPHAVDANGDAAPCLAHTTPPATVLLGDTTVEAFTDPHPAGLPEAASFLAGSGTVSSLAVYIDGGSAKGFEMGIYDDIDGEPGNLQGAAFDTSSCELTQGWYSAPLGTNVTLTGGHIYWIVFLCPSQHCGDGVGFRYKYTGSATGDGPCVATTSVSCTKHGQSAAVLPSHWGSGGTTATFFPSTNSFYAGP